MDLSNLLTNRIKDRSKEQFSEYKGMQNKLTKDSAKKMLEFKSDINHWSRIKNTF